MGGLKEFYLQRLELVAERLAQHLSLTLAEVQKLVYQSETNTAYDGWIYSYTLHFDELASDQAILKKISGLSSEYRLTVPPSIFLDESRELEAIEGADYRGTFFGELAALEQLVSIQLMEVPLQRLLMRQIYVGVITAVETYLSDAFINLVINSRDRLRKFVESHPEFKKQKLSFSDVFREYENIKDRAMQLMVTTVYHRLPTVREMYQSTLGVEFPDIGPMAAYIDRRHDLVHRSGKTSEGKHIVIDRDEMMDLLSAAKTFVSAVDSEINDKIGKNKIWFDDIPF